MVPLDDSCQILFPSIVLNLFVTSVCHNFSRLPFSMGQPHCMLLYQSFNACMTPYYSSPLFLCASFPLEQKLCNGRKWCLRPHTSQCLAQSLVSGGNLTKINTFAVTNDSQISVAYDSLGLARALFHVVLIEGQKLMKSPQAWIRASHLNKGMEVMSPVPALKIAA